MRKRVQPPDLDIKRTFISVDGDAVIGVLRVFPVNFDLKSEDGKNALRQFYQELFDAVSFPVQIYSRQVRKDLDSYIDQVGSGEELEGFREEYVEYCRQLSQEGIVDTEHYLIVRVPRTSNAVQELQRRLETLASVISGSSLGMRHVVEDQLQWFVRTEVDPKPVVTEEFCGTANDTAQGYRKLVYITGFPSNLDVGWLLKILRTDGLVDVTQVVDPVSVAAATRKLQRHSTKLEAEIAASPGSGHRGANKLERLADDANWFLDLLADQVCGPVRYGVYITVHGKTQEEVRKTFQRLKPRLHALRLEFSQPGHRNDYAYRTDSAFYPDRLNETFLMPSLSAATGFPFGTQPLEAENGVLYGFDVEDRTPILLDRFSWSSHSMAVTGTLGSGKSYTAHLELIRSVLAYPDLRLIVLDPKKEYGSTIEALGGEQRLIEHGKEYSFDQDIISFEPVERGEFDNVSAFVELLSQIYSEVSKDQRKTLVVVDEAHNILDDDTGRFVLQKFVLESRDINTAVHMISQSASHFTKYQEGKEILNEVVGELFFREKVVSDSMIDYYRLPDQKIWRLKNLRVGEEAGIGEALLHVDDVIDTRIRIPSTDLEHQVIEEGQEKESEVER